MDTRSVEEVERDIAEIKARMPETYASIKAKAAELGNQAFALVRAGLRGEPNKFWAMERGYVKGTPFNLQEINAEVALAMVQWGCAHACIWAHPVQGAASGKD